MPRPRPNLILALLLGLAPGCGDGCRPGASSSPPGDEVVLNLWHTFNREETRTLNTLLEQVEQEHPGWRVQSTVIPFSRAQNEFRRAAEGCADGVPDVFRSELPWVAEFVDKRLVRPLPRGAVDQGAYLPMARFAASYRGNWWILPASVDCLALLYNRDKVDEPPATIAALVEQGVHLTRDNAGRGPRDPGFEPARATRWGFYVRADAYWFLPFLWAEGGRLLDPKSGEVFIDQPEAVAALTLYRGLIRTHHIAPPRPSPANDYEEMMQRFGRGEVAMIVNGPWATAALLAQPAFRNQEKLGIAPFPVGSSGKPAAPTSGHGYLVSRCSKHPKQALALARRLSDTRAQLLFAEQNSLLPALRAVYQRPRMRTNRIIRRFKAALDRTRLRPKHPAMARIFDDFTPAVQAALLGDATPAEALAGVARAWRALLEPGQQKAAESSPAAAPAAADKPAAPKAGGSTKPGAKPSAPAAP